MDSHGSFIIRMSGKKSGYFYVDNNGLYKLSDISKITGLDMQTLEILYNSLAAEYFSDLEVYYFDSYKKAEELVSELISRSNGYKSGRLIFLSEKEIEYLRMALINDGSNTIHINSNIKDELFRKLNKY